MYTYHISNDNNFFYHHCVIIMWETEAKSLTTAPKERVWKLWSQVSDWNRWDNEVEKSEIFGTFAVGTKGSLKPVGGPKTSFEIIACQHLSTFTDRSFLPLCSIDFIHTLTETEHGLEVSHKVVMQGAMTWLFSRVIGKNIAHGLPGAVKKLVELAETDT